MFLHKRGTDNHIILVNVYDIKISVIFTYRAQFKTCPGPIIYD